MYVRVCEYGGLGWHDAVSDEICGELEEGMCLGRHHVAEQQRRGDDAL